ncbi:MAG: DUF6382 domain-containing protein [Suipraeoptans sp.]
MERYFTVEEKIVYNEDYQMKMMRNNSIKGLLGMRGMGINDCSQYTYEIGGKVSLKGLYERGKVTTQDIDTLLCSILAIAQEIEEYLLDLSKIYLKPEYIFYGDNNFYFCYYPIKEEELWTEFHELAKFLVDHIDYDDEVSIEKAHAMYEKSKIENYDLKALIYDCLSIQTPDTQEQDNTDVEVGITFGSREAQGNEGRNIDFDEESEIAELSAVNLESINIGNKKSKHRKKGKRPKWGEFDSLILDEEI